MALLLGAGPPLEFLDAGDDGSWSIQAAVVRRAAELDLERRQNEIEALARRTAFHTVRGISRLLKKILS